MMLNPRPVMFNSHYVAYININGDNYVSNSKSTPIYFRVFHLLFIVHTCIRFVYFLRIFNSKIRR